jgi:signal transduction histidine kinase
MTVSLRALPGFAVRLTVALSAADLLFKGMAFRACLDLAQGRRGLVDGMVLTSVLWFIAVAWSTRWIPCAHPALEVRDRAAAAVRRLPRLIVLGWALQWCGLCGVLAYTRPPASSFPGAMGFLAAVLLGSLPLAHSLTDRLVAPILRDLPGQGGGAGSAPLIALPWRLAIHAVCFCLAPVAFATSLPAIGRAGAVTFLIGITACAVACSVLVATSLTARVREMADVIRVVARQDGVHDVGRVPIYRLDEVGVLAGSTNEMLERLERSAAETWLATESFAALNYTLELRVAERTEGLQLLNVALADEMKYRDKMERELRQAQKLESIGRLASGVAHEINTPVQFVNDSVHFARDAVSDLVNLIERYRSVNRAVLAGSLPSELAAQATWAEEDADLEYLLSNVPKALERSLEGLKRVATIVRSMKQFAHPDRKEKSPVDLNEALCSTLTIARNEYKYVADVETDFGELPPVLCHAGELNQAILNIVVNAAHAIEDVVGDSGDRGTIRIVTRHEGDHVMIAIGDTGGGVPEPVRERIFDPFFTTKELGKGTGQGLSLAHAVVFERHGGTLTFETEIGKGTTFFIRVPVDGNAMTVDAAAA